MAALGGLGLPRWFQADQGASPIAPPLFFQDCPR
jgi:hypothetical protein